MMRSVNILLRDSLTVLSAPPDSVRRWSKLTTIGGQDGLTEDAPHPPPCPILRDIEQKYYSNWGYNGLLSPAHSPPRTYRRDLRRKVVTGHLLFQM